MDPMSPSVVLAAYAEPLLDGRRVVVFGDATSDLGAELAARGARSVHVFDPEPPRAALAAAQNRSKQITVVPLDTADIAIRDGAFDIALIPDLSALTPADPLLRKVRRALAPRGAALIASPNPDVRFTLSPNTSASRRAEPLGYYELYDTVAAVWDEVRMFGQTPFVGYAVVDFAPGDDPEVSIDSGLLPTGAEEPEWFIALASADAIETEAYSIVQLPASRIVAGVDTELESELRTARAREADLVERLGSAEADRTERADAGRAEFEARIAELESKLAARDEKLSKLERAEARAAELEKDAGSRNVRLRDLETELEKTTARARQSGTELEALRKKANEDGAAAAALQALTREKADLAAQVSALEGEKTKLAARVSAVEGEKSKLGKDAEKALAEKAAAEKALAEREASQGKLEQRAAAAEARAERLTAVANDAAPDDVARLETALTERGERLRALERDLREAERVGRELVRELKAAQAKGETGVSDGEQALGHENARLRADLEALSWTIQELEGRLSQASAARAR
jgi:SAM-dependent methyltransferase